MGGEELELLCAAAAGARYSEPIKKEGLNQGEGLNQTASGEVCIRYNLQYGYFFSVPGTLPGRIVCWNHTNRVAGSTVFEDDAAEAIVMRESISARIIRQSGKERRNFYDIYLQQR